MSAEHPTVLIVEDEPSQREVLRYNLEAEGFDIATAGSGDEALLLAGYYCLGLDAAWRVGD